MKENILNYIMSGKGKITFKELKRKFELDTITLNNYLLELKLNGDILQKGNRYGIFPNDLFIGDVSTSVNGSKVIFYNGNKIPVAKDSFNAVLYNDVVSFRINENNEAEIYSIIDRRIKNITCEVVIENGIKKVVPYHKDIIVNLSNQDVHNLLDGDIILVDIDKDIENEEECNAIIVKKIGNKDDPNIEEISIALNYGFDNDYSDEYLDELKQLPTSISEEDVVGRYDFRKTKTFTIDGIYTKDMDDALGDPVMSENGDITFRVDISDVSHFVKADSVMFKRACEKTTSLYLNDSVFHMFHHILSNGICSLNQGEDRLTKSVIITVDVDGNIVNYEIVNSVINSDKKMTYDDVDKILKDECVPDGYCEYVNDIKLLYEAACRIRKRMERDGLISFSSNELDKKYDADGNLISYKKMEESPGRKLIEFLMIAANESVANFMLYSGLPGVFRVHEFPDLKKVNDAIRVINEMGKRIKKVKEIDNPIVIQKMLQSLKDDENYDFYSTIVLRFLKRARYSTENLGHFALALLAYCHFTSPIRRLADLLVHMILNVLIETPELIADIDYFKMESDLDSLCNNASKMERQADLAEQVAERTAIIKRMKQDIGEEFEGTILEVGNKLKIRIDSVDVYVDHNSFSSYIKYDKKRHMFYDYTNGLYLKVGTKLLVRLCDVDVINRNLKVSVLNVIDPKTLKR